MIVNDITPQVAFDVISFPIADITIPADRQREKAEADQALITSIESRGLLNPIILHADGELVAGERRLDAHRKLGLTHILARIFERLTAIEQHEIELVENLARKQLTWQEEVRAVAGYHAIRLGAFATWTQLGTANALGLSASTISKYVVIAEQLDDEEVRNCQTMGAAFNLISARADRARVAAMSRGLDVAGAAKLIIPPAVDPNATPQQRTEALMKSGILNQTAAATVEELDAKIANIQAGKLAEEALRIEKAREVSHDIILNTDFLEWAASYEGAKFDVIHADFPYGKNYSGSRTRRTGKAHINPTYADSPDVYFALLEGFLEHQDNFCFPVAHCIFWFDMQYYQVTIDAFESAGWHLVQPFPLIWTKGFEGVAADVRRRPRHCYETALLFSRGDRKIVKLTNDHFGMQTDEKLHINQKPWQMLQHFLSLVVDEHTAILDPTCGSGSALVAAQKLKAHRLLGLELDTSNAEVARFLLQRHTPMTVQPGEEE